MVLKLEVGDDFAKQNCLLIQIHMYDLFFPNMYKYIHLVLSELKASSFEMSTEASVTNYNKKVVTVYIAPVTRFTDKRLHILTFQ